MRRDLVLETPEEVEAFIEFMYFETLYMFAGICQDLNRLNMCDKFADMYGDAQTEAYNQVRVRVNKELELKVAQYFG